MMSSLNLDDKILFASRLQGFCISPLDLSITYFWASSSRWMRSHLLFGNCPNEIYKTPPELVDVGIILPLL